jgi:hypothetical protein
MNAFEGVDFGFKVVLAFSIYIAIVVAFAYQAFIKYNFVQRRFEFGTKYNLGLGFQGRYRYTILVLRNQPNMNAFQGVDFGLSSSMEKEINSS